MELKQVDSLWYRQLNPGDYFTIERSDEARPAGGGGQGYVDIPGTLRDPLFQFLGVQRPASDEGPWPPAIQIDARVIGAPDLVSPLIFSHRGESESDRYRIANQRRQGNNPGRHPAWTAQRGFPTTPDDVATTEEAARSLPDGGVRLFVVKTVDGEYYAGFAEGNQLPQHWPEGVGFERLFEDSPGGRIILRQPGLDIPGVVAKILEAWTRKPNVLLYGPPGTGKTFAMSVVRQLLELGLSGSLIGLDVEDQTRPFQLLVPSISLPTPITQDWITFHQNYSYEDFVMGLRPRSTGASGFELKPRVGRLLEAAIKVSRSEEPPKSAVLFIDEVNRGNVSRIFGEFITFMDFDYRDVDHQGSDNANRLPVPFPSIDISEDETEELQRPNGTKVRLKAPWFFPRHVYTLSSMNSVDRTVAPLDSALSRRIERIELRPDTDILAAWLHVDKDQAIRKVRQYLQERPEGGSLPDLSPTECAWLLLRKLNDFLATTLGPDFELGHTYFFDVGLSDDESQQFANLAVVWDRFVFPQLQERFVIRPEELLRILKVGEADSPENYAFRTRTGLFDEDAGDRPTVEAVSLADLAVTSPDSLRVTLRFLACP